MSNWQANAYKEWLKQLQRNPADLSIARRAAHSGLLAGKDSVQVKGDLTRAGVSAEDAKRIVDNQIKLHKFDA